MSAYPKMIYNEDGRTHVLASASDPRPEGDWSDTPTSVHRRGGDDHTVTHQTDPDESLAHKVADIIIGRLVAEGLVGKRGPGRPPKSDTDKGGSDAGE